MALTTFEFCTVNSDLRIVFTGGSVRQGIAPTGTAAATTVVSNAGQTVCRVATDTAVYVSFGEAPNATSDTVKFFLPANTVELFRVPANSKGSVVTI